MKKISFLVYKYKRCPYSELSSCNVACRRTLILARPFNAFISPKKTDIKELFPAPTAPTTDTIEPSFILIFILVNVGGSAVSVVHENVPFSITNASSPKKKKVIEMH